MKSKLIIDEKHRMSRECEEQGSAMIVALVMATVLALLGVTYLAVSMTDRNIAANEADGMQAFNVAEAGLDHAIAELPDQDFDTLLAGGGTLFASQSLGDGAYGVTIRNNVAPEFPTGLVPLDAGGSTDDTDGYVVVSSTGVVDGARRVVEQVFRMKEGKFMYAAWADGKMTVSGGGSTDSYNSNSGPYDPLSPSLNGTVFSNTELKFSGGSTVGGDAECAGSALDPSAVTGTSNGSQPTQAMPLMACPATGYPASVPATPGVTYDPVTGVLKVSGSTLSLPVPPTQYYFSEVKLSGGATLQVANAAGDAVDFYVAGKLTVSGGGAINNVSAVPANLALIACGASTKDWVLSGGSGAYFTVYAPNRKVTVSGTGDIWGAVIAGELTASGGSQIHYDEALGGGGMKRVEHSWTEVY